MSSRRLAVIAAAVLWSGFVWGTRIRNALTDDDLQGTALTAVILLSLSFLVPALAVAVVAWRGRAGGSRRLLRSLVGLNLAWTSVVWVLRGADIAFGGDHEAGFIIVHLILGVVSVALWVWAFAVVRETNSEIIPAAC